MTQHTPADALGRGVAFGFMWDFEVSAGSIGLVDGHDLLGRDLAFGTIQELGPKRGNRFTPELAEDVKIALRRVANRDGRVNRIVPPIEVSEGDGTDWVEIALQVVADTHETGEFVLTL